MSSRWNLNKAIVLLKFIDELIDESHKERPLYVFASKSCKKG